MLIISVCLTQYIKLIKQSKLQLIVHKCWKLPNYHITTQQGAGVTILAVQYKTVNGENMARSIMKFWWPDEKWQIWLLARWICKKKTLDSLSCGYVTMQLNSHLFNLWRFYDHVTFLLTRQKIVINNWACT